MGSKRVCMWEGERTVFVCVRMGNRLKAWTCGVPQRQRTDFVLQCLMVSMYSMCVEGFQVMSCIPWQP